MRKRLIFILFLSLFIIIPSNHVFALSGSYNLSTYQVVWTDKANNNNSYTGSSSSSYYISNENNTFYQYYQNLFNSLTTSQNGETTYAPTVIQSTASSTMSIQSTEHDLDVSIEYGWSCNGACSSTYWTVGQQFLENASSIQVGQVVLHGTNINNESKTFYCLSTVVSTDYSGSNKYVKMVATCNTSNFKSIDHVSFNTNLYTISNSESFGFNLYVKKLNYVTSTYTGLHDSDGNPSNSGGGSELDDINSSITDATQAIETGLDNLENTMKDDTIDSSFQDSTMNSINGQLASNNVISDLLLLPVNMYQRILNSVNGTCTAFNLGSLYGTSLTMPCIQPQNYLGSTLWGVIDILFCGFFILAIRKKFVDIFNNMTNLKNGGNEIE